MKDALRVSITCPAISCLMIVLSSPPLPAELTISLMCGWIEVRVLVGGQDLLHRGLLPDAQPGPDTYVYDTYDMYIHMPSVVGHTSFIHGPVEPP